MVAMRRWMMENQSSGKIVGLARCSALGVIFDERLPRLEANLVAHSPFNAKIR